MSTQLAIVITPPEDQLATQQQQSRLLISHRTPFMNIMSGTRYFPKCINFGYKFSIMRSFLMVTIFILIVASALLLSQLSSYKPHPCEVKNRI